jgi:hypothetical protein
MKGGGIGVYEGTSQDSMSNNWQWLPKSRVGGMIGS